MDNEINILKIFYEKGFVEIMKNFEDIINQENLFTNFIISNITNKKNLKLLCNFIKLDILKYKNLCNEILLSDLKINYKKEFIYNILNNGDINNIEILNEKIYEIILDDLENFIKSNEEIEGILELLLYKIMDNKIVEKKENNLYFYTYLLKELDKRNEKIIRTWMFDVLHLFNYRIKSYVTMEYEDSILYILLNSIFINYKDVIMDEKILEVMIEKNIDLLNINYDKMNEKYEKEDNFMIKLFFYKIIKITIFFTIEDIDYYENKIKYLEENNDNINNNIQNLESFNIIKDYLIDKNTKNINIYKKKYDILINKLNKDLMNNINNYYLIIIKYIEKIEIKENNEFYSNLIINIINLYLYKNNKLCFENNDEKISFIYYIFDLLNNEKSNINVNIKCMYFIKHLLIHDISVYNFNNDVIIKLLNNILSFYISFDNYEDELVKYSIRILITSVLNLYLIYINKKIIFEIDEDLLLKFIIRLNEENSLIIENTLYYIENNKYSNIEISLDELNTNICLNKFIIINLNEKISDIIMYNIIYKYNNNIKIINNTKKNSVYINRLLLYIIRFYNILNNNEKYLLCIKNDTNYDYDIIKNKIEKLKEKHVNNSELNNFYNLIKKIEEMEKIEEIDKNNVIPEEFLDPIYNTLIINPIILPNTNIIMDYDILKQHLLYNNFDPFNREELDIEMVNIYNMKEENIKKINELKEKINKWKNENIK